MKNLFIRKTCYRNSTLDLLVPSAKTVHNGQNSLRYLGPLIWNSIPIGIRIIDTFVAFKSKIVKWKPIECPCRLCKEFIAGVGFVKITR